MCHGGALFPEVFKDKASPQYPTAAMQNTQGVHVPPSTSLSSSLVWAVTAREGGLQCAGPILPLSKGRMGAWDPALPGMPVKDP